MFLFRQKPPDVPKLTQSKDVAGLVKALSYNESIKGGADYAEAIRIREAAAQALGSLRDPRAVKDLTLLMQRRLHHISKLAVTVLGDIGDPGSAAALAGELGKAIHTDTIQEIRQALVKIGKPAIPFLADGIRQGDNETRFRMVEALECFAQPTDEVFSALLPALGDTEGHIRKRVVEVLDKMGWNPTQGGEWEAWYWVEKGDVGKCRDLGASAIPALIQSLNGWTSRFAAANMLANLGAEAVEPLISALQKGSMVAAEALGKIGDLRAVEPLLAALPAGSGYVPDALAKIKDPRAIDPLIAQLNHSDDKFQANVAIALVGFGDPRAIDGLLLAVADKGNEAASNALARVAPDQVIPKLIGDLKVADPRRRSVIIQTLAKMGKSAVPVLLPLLTDADPAIRKGAMDALAIIDDPQASVELKSAQERFKLELDSHLNQLPGGDQIPQVWRSGEYADRLMRILEESRHQPTSSCPMFLLGLCQFRVVAQNNTSFGPESCTWKGQPYQECFVYRQIR